MNFALAVTLLATIAVSPPSPSCRTVFYASGGDMGQGLLCRPANDTMSPAVIVIHPRSGLTDWAKLQAKRLADSGYVALAVDLFRGDLPRDSVERVELARLTPPGQRERDLAAGLRFLRQQPFVRGDRIGVIGYCMGGSFAFQSAVDDSQFEAMILHYPTSFGQLATATDTAGVRRIRAPVLGIFGGKDAVIPLENVRAFEATMRAAGKQVEVVVYPDAGHAFDYSSDTARPADAADAWRRDLAFLAAHLRR